MKIRRYFFPMYSGVPDDPNGDWVKWEDVKPLLERIKELEKRQCDCADWGDDEECSKHPCAPHGYDRSSSHAEGRYVCDCEGWGPPERCNGKGCDNPWYCNREKEVSD